jgi:hypothetical protein
MEGGDPIREPINGPGPSDENRKAVWWPDMKPRAERIAETLVKLVYSGFVLAVVLGIYGSISTRFETVAVSMAPLIFLHLVRVDVERSFDNEITVAKLDYMMACLAPSPRVEADASEREPSTAEIEELHEKERRGFAWERDRVLKTVLDRKAATVWHRVLHVVIYCIVGWNLLVHGVLSSVLG